MDNKNKQLHVFFKHSTVGMARVRFSDACCMDVNQSFCKMLGRTREEMLSIPWMEITHPEDIDLDYTNFKKMAAGELESYSVEKRYIHANGEIIWVKLNLTLIRDDLGKPDYEIAIISDINVRKLAEQALIQSRIELEVERNRLLTIIETIPTGLILIDKNGDMILENDEWLKTWRKDLSTHKNIEYDMYKGYRPDTGERINANDWPCAISFKQGLSTKDVIVDIEKFDGEHGTIVISSKPILNDKGEIVGAVAANMDITELRSTQKQLQDADRRKDEFLAMLSHELRNPLAPISAASQLLSIAKLDEAQLKKTSQIISRQVHHLNQLLEDLLDVSRVTRGIVSLSKSNHDLKEVVKDAVEQIRPLLEQKGHQFVLNLSPESAYVFGDKDRLVQVIANLLNNAAKYTPAQGIIQLDLKVFDETVILKVSDNGIGVAKDFQSQMFDLFTQSERTSDRTQGGLGLGLALVSKIVSLHDGEVSCESAGLGLGSSFTVILPRIITCEESNGSTGIQIDKFDGPSKLKILVVDDNIDAAISLQILLETIGHEVLAVNDSYLALEKARQAFHDVIILDIGLPKINGYEVARRIRQIPIVSKSTLIALTGYGQIDDINKAIDAGFDHHLVKPLDFDNLMKILDKCEGRITSLK